MRGLYKLYHVISITTVYIYISVISITISSGNYKPINITGGFLAVALFSGPQTLTSPTAPAHPRLSEVLEWADCNCAKAPAPGGNHGWLDPETLVAVATGTGLLEVPTII